MQIINSGCTHRRMLSECWHMQLMPLGARFAAKEKFHWTCHDRKTLVACESSACWIPVIQESLAILKYHTEALLAHRGTAAGLISSKGQLAVSVPAAIRLFLCYDNAVRIQNKD